MYIGFLLRYAGFVFIPLDEAYWHDVQAYATAMRDLAWEASKEGTPLADLNRRLRSRVEHHAPTPYVSCEIGLKADMEVIYVESKKLFDPVTFFLRETPGGGIDGQTTTSWVNASPTSLEVYAAGMRIPFDELFRMLAPATLVEAELLTAVGEQKMIFTPAEIQQHIRSVT